MRGILETLLVTALLLAGGCKVASTEVAASPGRWQVIQTEYSQRNEKQPILLDTYTGETWVPWWDSNKGYTWKRAERRQD